MMPLLMVPALVLVAVGIALEEEAWPWLSAAVLFASVNFTPAPWGLL